MAARSLVLIARPDQRQIVQNICAQVDVAAVLVASRRRLADWPVPTFSDLETLRRDIAVEAACFLTPYANLKQDLSALVDTGVHILCGGPISLSRKEFDTITEKAKAGNVGIALGGRHFHSQVYKALVRQRGQQEFGNPVYLRQISGGGTALLPAWWSACELLEQATEILDADLKTLHIAANRQGAKHHITLTAALQNRSNAQLVVAPIHLATHADVLLLGSGGLVYGESSHNALPLIKENGVQLLSPPNQHPEASWISAFLAQLDQGAPALADWSALARQNKLLTAIRRALKQQQPIPVKLGA